MLKSQKRCDCLGKLTNLCLKTLFVLCISHSFLWADGSDSSSQSARVRQTDTSDRHLGDWYRAIHDSLCISSSINNSALKDCHRAGSRRLSDAREKEAGHHSAESLHVKSLEERGSAQTVFTSWHIQSLYNLANIFISLIDLTKTGENVINCDSVVFYNHGISGTKNKWPFFGFLLTSQSLGAQ